jgi:hypothetical protein|tara:strand:+ start:613 stop:789 length:177 start_codon:yes stop_codon:yes gene_type:complete
MMKMAFHFGRQVSGLSSVFHSATSLLFVAAGAFQLLASKAARIPRTQGSTGAALPVIA